MTELFFEKKNTVYECKVGTTNGIVQVSLSGTANLSVSANLPGMPPSVLRTLHNPYSNSIVFELNIPDGMEVYLQTSVPVIKAYIM